jgi:hypothetical protein
MSVMLRLISASVFLFTVNAYAFDLPINHIPKFSPMMFPPTSTTNFNFEGIVALNNCSGSIVRFENSKDTDKAMVFTNGHCYEGGMPSFGTFVSHHASQRTFSIMGPDSSRLGTLKAQEVIYSTMTGTDVTIYLIQQTYAEILSRYNVRPLTLQSRHPEVGDQIEVISGFWSRGYSCAIEAFIPHLQEDQWTMTDSIRYSRPGCEVIGGTSGSPVVITGTRTMVGINNTGNDNGEMCTMDNPCEIDDHGSKSAHKGFSYGQETYEIYSCINQANEFDLAVPGCQLLH